MTHMMPLLPALACGALMFGGGALAWLARRTRVARVTWIPGRARARSSHDGQGRQA
jgi:hypothetical protein